MALSSVKSKRMMKRMESRKSHSWWWDSHISPKNSKWLAENLEEMDQHVKQMLKLIEADGESFLKKADAYFQRRPELIHLVEEFYRMYRALAERYDQVTGELRRRVPPDLQSQGSTISDIGPESSPSWILNRHKSGPQAADFGNKEGDKSSSSDSESDTDDSSVNNYSGVSVDGDDQQLQGRIIELEVELHEVKEKLRREEEDGSNGSIRGTQNEKSVLLGKISSFEEQLRIADERVLFLEKEINTLTPKLQKYESYELEKKLQLKLDGEVQKKIEMMEIEISESRCKIQEMEEELLISREKLQASEQELASLRNELGNNKHLIQHLQDQLGSAEKNISMLKSENDNERKMVSNLQDTVARYKTNLSEREEEIRGLKDTISNASKSLSETNSQLQSEMTRLLSEKTYLQDSLEELDERCHSLEEEVRLLKDRKAEIEVVLGVEISQLKGGIAEKNNHIEDLNKTLDALKLKYDMLTAQRDEINARVSALLGEQRSKDIQIDEMSKHMHQLHMEHVKLISGMESAEKASAELRLRVRELEKEVEMQQEMFQERAEEKREAIRQLCFSLDHYRNGYQRLRRAFVEHKRLPVMAS